MRFLTQEIQPYETKALMRVSFVGRVASNHTAFIRIKASQPAPNQELLILPVEVEVTAGNGELYFFGFIKVLFFIFIKAFVVQIMEVIKSCL